MSSVQPLQRQASYISTVRNDKIRPPLLTLLLVIANIVVYYTMGPAGKEPAGRFYSAHCIIPTAPPGSNGCYGPDETAVWARSLVASFFHNNDAHLWGNMASTLLIGTIIETSEGKVHLGCITWGAATLGYAMFGLFKADDYVYAAGFSGALYGMIFSLFALLLLNWTEMNLRWLRLLINMLALGQQIYEFTLPGASTAFAVHGFGALGGICVSLILGRNVRLSSSELYLTWFGVVTYVAVALAGLGDGQTAPALLSLLILPVLVWHAVRITKRVREAATSVAVATDNFDDELELVAQDAANDLVEAAQEARDAAINIGSDIERTFAKGVSAVTSTVTDVTNTINSKK